MAGYCSPDVEARHLSTIAVESVSDDGNFQSLSSVLASATAHLSDAQVSRVAAQSVRLSIREGEFGDALYVVNSACHSVLRNPVQPEEEVPNDQTSQIQPIAFGRPVSPRLAAHAFLHGLLRRGYSLKAQTYARLMVQVGIPIHRKTLESIIAAARSSRYALPRLGPFARVIPRKRVNSTQSVLQLQTGVVTDQCTRAAVELLQTARTFGQRRTERMYRVLISTLLMQGEIIVASLLFVLLIKDWELRKLQDSGAQGEVKEDWVSYGHLGVARPPVTLLAMPYPDPKIMSNILDTIDAKFARSSDFQSDPTLFSYLQSLAVFAMLLDTGQLHTHRVASVIRTLYHCPKTETSVWILQDGQPVYVKAYTFFHDVLKRLVNALGESSRRTPPSLSRRAYNTLLSYSLRHQFSPAMASEVLHHMCVKREPPIPPDVVTYNILIRSGTLLRQMYISKVALTALRTGSNELGLDSSPFEGLAAKEGPSLPGRSAAHEVPPSSSVDIAPCDMLAALARLETERLIVPRKVAAPTAEVKADPSTLTSFINHLTATGRPQNIVDVLFDILPELFIIDHPATNGTPASASKMSRQQALKRAARHGPYVYAALLNALVKAGEVGLAERVFILAQQAERASQIPGFADDIDPWRLSIHAYTSMMQCYARVAHGRLPTFKRSKFYVGSALLTRDAAWMPKARHFRQGYAQYVYMANTQSASAQVRFTKRQIGRRNAMLLYRSMMSGGRALLANMIMCNTSPNRLSPRRSPHPGEPTWFTLLPDERFFNAALQLFGRSVRRDSSHRRTMRSHTPSLPHEKEDIVRAEWTPMLHRLAKAIVENGYSIPERYRHFLEGKWRGPMTVAHPRKTAARRPYAFSRPPQDDRSADVLPTVKTRGLPLRKKRPAWMRRRQTQASIGTKAVA